MNIDELITGFNSEDKPTINKIKSLFRSIPIFVKYLIKIGKVEELSLGSFTYIMDMAGERDLRSAVYSEILKSTGPDYFLKYFQHIVKEKDGYYFTDSWSLADTLSGLMPDYETSRAVEEALGSDWVNMFDIYSDNINYFYDIVKNLDNYNKKYLKERILYYCGTEKFHKTDFNWWIPNEEYFDQRGMFSVYDNIDDIIRNDELFDMVIDLKVLDDLKFSLTSLYNIAYNESWGDQMKVIILSAFSPYFDMDTLVSKEDRGFKVKIKNFDEVLSKYFECGAQDGLYINYDEMLYSLFYDTRCMKLPVIKVINRPERTKVNEFLNEYFIDNVH